MTEAAGPAARDTCPAPALDALGPRICIIGRSNAGKSTLAQAIAKKTGLPARHLDQIAHTPHTNWERRPDADFLADHAQWIAGDQWVMDGNYSIGMPERFGRATAIIWLDMGFAGFLCRYILRSLRGNKHRPGALSGATSEFGFKLIAYNFRQYPKNRARYKELLDQSGASTRLVHMRDMRTLNRFYRYWGLV